MHPLRFPELHHYLSSVCGLVPEPEHSGSWRSYFLERIEWHPARTTRILKVILDQHGEPLKILRCVSSDNNNSVFFNAPFELASLKQMIEEEISLWRQA